MFAKRKERKENSQSIKQIFRNNLFLLKLCFKAAPLNFIMFVVEAIRNELVIFLEFTIGLNFVLESAEFHRPFHEVAIFLVGLFLFVALGLLFNAFLYHKVQQKAMPKIKRDVRKLLYNKAAEIDIDYYDNPEFYNDFILAISESNKQIDRSFEFLSKVCTGLTGFVSVGTFYIIKDPISAIFIAASFFLTFLFTQLINKLNYKIRLEYNPKERKRAYINRLFYLNEYAKEIRLNQKIGDVLLQNYEEANVEMYQIAKKYAKKKFMLSFVKSYICDDFIHEVLYLTYLVYKAAVMHAISYSSVVILFNSFNRFRGRMRLLTEVYPFAAETSLYVEKIQSFLQLEPKIISTKGLEASIEAKKITLNNVTFGYTKKEGPIINDISLTIEPGEKIALVGYNGAGKTTLIKLLMRLYDAWSGEILINDIPIKDYDPEQYRKTIGAIFQDYKLYAATVKENVIMDLTEKVEDEKVESALAESDFANRLDTLESGIHTNLTTEFDEDGVNLSGGESQKVAIARVFFKKCGLIILDEPSSALDPIAEYKLNETMLKATENKTVIFISHRLSTTRQADRIIMLGNGRIIEQGTHEQLLSNDGKYATMWRAQAKQYLQTEKAV